MQQFCEVCAQLRIRRFAYYPGVKGEVCFEHRIPETESKRDRARTLLASPVPEKRTELRHRLAGANT
jgi:hypothetical protein